MRAAGLDCSDLRFVRISKLQEGERHPDSWLGIHRMIKTQAMWPLQKCYFTPSTREFLQLSRSVLRFDDRINRAAFCFLALLGGHGSRNSEIQLRVSTQCAIHNLIANFHRLH
jgi:hypothetical protein